MWAKQKGFTIVELLIVIVVIAILAAITIVAFNGVQDRAKYTRTANDLSVINRAVQAYYSENGSYPLASAWRYSCDYGNPIDFIPTLTSLVRTLPQAPCGGGSPQSDTYLYRSDGDGYKLLMIRAIASNTYRSQVPDSMRDRRWNGVETTWGYWTANYEAM